MTQIKSLKIILSKKVLYNTIPMDLDTYGLNLFCHK